MQKLRRYSLMAAAAAVIAEGGAKNIALSALITVGTPATATGFVYEVMQMRHASLEREARDRISQGSKTRLPESAPGGDKPDEPVQHEEAAGESLKHKLEAMVATRAQYYDLYGDNPETIAPAYQKLLRGMLEADARMLAEIEATKVKDYDVYDRDLRSGGARLAELHRKLAALLPPEAGNDRMADSSGPKALP